MSREKLIAAVRLLGTAKPTLPRQGARPRRLRARARARSRNVNRPYASTSGVPRESRWQGVARWKIKAMCPTGTPLPPLPTRNVATRASVPSDKTPHSARGKAPAFVEGFRQLRMSATRRSDTASVEYLLSLAADEMRALKAQAGKTPWQIVGERIANCTERVPGNVIDAWYDEATKRDVRLKSIQTSVDKIALGVEGLRSSLSSSFECATPGGSAVTID